MRTSRLTWTAVVLAATLVALPSAADAQDAASAQALKAEIDQLKKDFDARLADLESRLAALSGASATQPTTAATSAPPSTPEPPSAEPPAVVDTSGSASASSGKMFNPDMSVIGNFLGAAGKNDVRPEPALQLPESEMSLQAVVDPYARADFFISFGEQGVAVEEGYVTFPTLPGGLLFRAGRMRAAFGKINTLHTHVMQTADRPLVTENLVGGEDGISDAGLSVARLIPNPWVFLEATGQVFRGDSADVFRSGKRGDLSYVGHVRGYQDLSESTNVDLGVSFTHGHNDSGVVNDLDIGRFTTNMFGLDATVRWKPLQRSIYHSFIGRSEVIWNRRDQPGGLQSASGFYVSGDYQLGRRWFTGLRLDRSDRAADASTHDSGTSLIVTYWPSEFSQARAQVRRTNYAEGVSANELLFQLQFAIGAHGAHPF